MKSVILENMVVNDVTKKHPDTISVFHRYSIDACCGGSVSIKEAAKRDGVSLDELLISLNEAAEKEG